MGQVPELLALFRDPQLPVTARAVQESGRPFLAHGPVDARDLAEVLADGDPVPAGGLPALGDVQMQRHGRVDAALSHGVAGEPAVLRVAPRALPVLRLLGAHRPLIHAQRPAL